ncbi:MAG: hypothetical protein ACOX1P_18190 [Thermoguttaceae bacterium]
MKQRIVIVLEDDWELNGNGTGNIAESQHIPATYLMNLAKKYGFRISFMVEVLQQLAFKIHEHKSNQLRVQAALWDGTVREMRLQGHDVQLHLHPQWVNARYEHEQFRVDRNWNIATYPRAERVSMINDALAYLKNLLCPIDPQYVPHSIKAGSWALQPSRGILEDLRDAGIKIVLGVGLGIHLQSCDFHVDYRELDSPIVPYYPDFDDIRRCSRSRKAIAVIPLAYYHVGLRDIAARLGRRIWPRLSPSEQLENYSKHTQTVTTPSPLGRQMRYARLRPLDIAANPFGELRRAIDSIISRAANVDSDYVPVVLQSHTKRYRNNWKTLAKFFDYVTDRYRNIVEFATLSDVLPHLESSIMPVEDD